MSDELPAEEWPLDPTDARRALIIWYRDSDNTIELYDDEFTYLEVPELLRAAMDQAEWNAPVPADLETEEEE